jgi:hypothetical protein
MGGWLKSLQLEIVEGQIEICELDLIFKRERELRRKGQVKKKGGLWVGGCRVHVSGQVSAGSCTDLPTCPQHLPVYTLISELLHLITF